MKLSEKIYSLRKKYNYSQNTLAEKCDVTRQAIYKWEANLAYPELDKLILLSDIFNISLDTLLKDDLNLDEKVINNTCHQTIEVNFNGYYEGLLIKESISDENIIDVLNINKVELWKTKSTPKYWTALYFTSSDIDLPTKFSKIMIKKNNWFVDFKHNNIKYIVFKDKILKYTIGNSKEKNLVAQECKKLGISNIYDISE